MEELNFKNDKEVSTKDYSEDVEALKKMNPKISGISMDITLNTDLGLFFIKIGERTIAVTSEQAFDIINIFKEGIKKINPKLLESNRHGR